MAPKKQKDQKKQPKKKDITALDLPPLPTDTQDILLQIPHLVHDHVSDHKTLTERFSKEGRCMHKLAELQKLSLADSPNHLEYRPNPYNRHNHQYVIGKALVSEPPSGVEDPNKVYLDDVRRIKSRPIDKQVLPLTSSQEIGWFTKTQPLCSFRKEPKVNHPRKYTALSQYMDTYWTYYPPSEAKFHPRDK